MIFTLSGIKCQVCGMALENANYDKDGGEGLYWVNPAISPYTDQRVDFCGVNHSFEWHSEKIKAGSNPTQNNDQTTD